MGGWIKLDRAVQDHWLWDERPFGKGQAWVDMIMLANHKPKKGVYKGQLVTYERGTINRSLLSLGERWGWSTTKVRNFMELLQADEMIRLDCNTNRTVITLLNYDKYQSEDGGEEKPKKDEEKKQKQADTMDYKAVQDAWNAIAGKYNLSQIKSVTATRKRTLKQRAEAEWIDGFQKIHKSKFLQGENDRGWKPNFDWIIKPINFQKLVEDSYQDRKPKAKKNSFTGYDERQSTGDDLTRKLLGL